MVGVVYESRDQNQDFQYHVARNFAYIFSSILIVEVNPVLSIREFNKFEVLITTPAKINDDTRHDHGSYLLCR